MGVEPVIEISLPDSIPHCNSSELRLSSERIQHVCHKPMKKGIPKTVILYQVGQPLVPKGFVYFFLRVLGCTAASLLPQQAKRTFRKFTTKPSEQVAAPPGNIFDYHFSLTTLHPCYVAGPSDNALVVDTDPASNSSRRNSYSGGGGGPASLVSMSVYLNRHNGLDRTCRQASSVWSIVC